MQYVIIGSGIAGISAAKTLREHQPDSEVTVFTTEFHPLGLYASHKLIENFRKAATRQEDFLLESSDDLARLGIQLVYDEVRRVFPSLHQVLKKHAMRQTYTALLLAMGSTPRLTAAPGYHHLGVHQLYNYEDLLFIENWMEQLQKDGAVVLGDSAEGIELALALKERGVPTSLITSANSVSRIEELQAREITVITRQHVTAFLSHDNKVLDGVQLRSGQLVTARMAINMNGVLPLTGILEETGIELDEANAAVRVNERFQTNLENIYAAGSCASVNGVIVQDWDAAAEQGKRAAFSMMGMRVT